MHSQAPHASGRLQNAPCPIKVRRHSACFRAQLPDRVQHARSGSRVVRAATHGGDEAQRDPLSASRDTLQPEDLVQLLRSKESADEERSGPGEVYLVGTGPGDPGLLTLHALRLMQTADVVLYDRLVSDDIMRLVHGGALLVYVGKQAGLHTLRQEDIHERLCQFAQAGQRVLRLKGGDPYIFGRGGEEALYLQQRGIAVHCIPGITAASGIGADIGVPLTHRGLATSVKYLTGHSRDGGEEQLDEAIDTSIDRHTTLVIYMGLNTLPEVSKRLMVRGLDSNTPAVAVERGTLLQQRAVFGSLSQLHERVEQHQLQSPTLIIIGDVVSLAPGWAIQQQGGSALVAGSSGMYLQLDQRQQELMQVELELLARTQ